MKKQRKRVRVVRTYYLSSDGTQLFCASLVDGVTVLRAVVDVADGNIVFTFLQCNLRRLCIETEAYFHNLEALRGALSDW